MRYYKVFFIVCSIFSATPIISQTTLDESLQLKYQNYREKFLKNFICLKPGVNGNGIPINNNNFFHYGSTGAITDPNITSNPQYYDATSGRLGTIKQGDAPEQIGFYLAVLAMEYRLLKDEGKNTTATVNQLYYAIQALNRLDFKAESYLSAGAVNGSLDGFLIRSDGDPQLTNYFNSEFINSQDKRDNFKFTSSDATDVSGNAVTTPTNAFSKDHVLDILEGFTFVKKFVDNVTAQPTSSDFPIFIHNEIRDITNRIMNRIVGTYAISDTEFKDISNDLFQCSSNNIKISMNWVIFDLINNKLVPRGNNFNLFAYPIAKMANYITGGTWDSNPVKIKIDGSFCTSWNYTLFDKSYNIGSTSDFLPNEWIILGNKIVTVSSAISDPAFCEDLFNINIFNTNKKVCMWLYDKANTAQATSNINDTYQLCMTLGTLSNTWPQSNIVTVGDSRFFYHYDLMFALLNGTSTIHNKSYFENILNSAPCQGPYNYNYPNLDPNTSLNSWDPEWHHNNRWVHPQDAGNTYNFPTTDNAEQGEFHGLDYMFLYNMYRLYYRNQINLEYGKDESCPCETSGKVASNTIPPSYTTVSNNFTFNRKFSSYKNIGIYLKEYINNFLSISNNKTVTNNTNLVLCNNALLAISNTGKFLNNATTTPNDSIITTVRKGSIVNVNFGGILEVGSNSKIVIEEGGTLFIANGGIAIIDNNNASIIMKSGAKLEIQNGGKLIINDNSKVVVQLGAQFILHPNTEIQLKGKNSLLDVQDVNTVINLSNNTEQILFTNVNGNSQGGTAQFAGGDFSHGTGAKLIIKNCTVKFLYNNKGAQMTYHYVSNADLQLQGDKAVLDLQGDLFIGNGAKFKFSWPGNNKHGYLKFSRPGWWGGNTVPHIIPGKLGGCSFELIGNGLSDKMMEVAQETVYMPDDSKFLFTVKYSRIEFTEQQGRLQVPCDYDIQFNTFICPNLSSLIFPPRGLTTFGQNSKPINNCLFIDFFYDGLNAELFYGGNKLFLNNCYFNNASTLVHGRGADITQCNFTKGYNSLDFIASNANSNIKNCSFSSTLSHIKGGVYKTPFTTQRYYEYEPFQGYTAHQAAPYAIFSVLSGPILLNIDNCSVKGFEVGIGIDGQGVANIKCGEIKNNDFGIVSAVDAKVYMSSTSPLNIGNQSVTGGYVDAEDNGITIFSWYSGGEINLMNGFNNLSPNNPGNPWTFTTITTCCPHNSVSYTAYTGNPVIYGQLEDVGCTNTPAFVQADRNHWKKNLATTNNYFVDSVNTVFYEDCTNPSYFSGNRVYFQDPFELSKNQLPGCPSSGPCPTCRTTPIANCSNCSNINTSQLGTTASNNAAKTGDNEALLNTTVSNKKAISLYSDVLKSNIRTTGSAEDKYVNKYSHHRLHQAFADAYDQKQIPDSLPTQPDFVNAIQALDAQITPLNISGDYNNTIFTLLEKAQLYRMARLRNDALVIFNQALVLANNQRHKDYINKLICMTTIEIDALAYPERKGEFSAKLDSCSGRKKNVPSSARFNNQTETNPDYSFKNLNESINEGYTLKVYPNPTSGELYIAYKFDEVGTDNEFIITDIAGKTVMSFKLQDQGNIIKTDSKELNSGIYFYQLKQNGKTLKADKLVISK